MLSLAAYMQARARHTLEHGDDEDADIPRGPLRRIFSRFWGYVRWAWAILFIVAGVAVWFSWLWALAVLALSSLPPLVGKAVIREAQERTLGGRRRK
ncbi:hypothetical protein OP10G_0855 [Fimbriimonas ginsengisoli Gsoil 348]|uniref:Transmembrane protein n=2 Tax=Fimbriimonas ginsengisoli TaxID=1005039 RepID=A0A068NKV3_FIMGI|nr:hypothetical protein OP10G_0855 [Fimbriimonas ginsengisoli Gsoil 348]